MLRAEVVASDVARASVDFESFLCKYHIVRNGAVAAVKATLGAIMLRAEDHNALNCLFRVS